MGGDQASGGRIELICGCMFSGKSERLIQRIRQARARGIDVAAFKHATDDRYDPADIVTHSGWREPAIPVAGAARIAERVGDARLVVIDEAQFFDADLAPLCQQLAAEGREVVLAGLDRDAWSQPFGQVPRIERVAQTITRLQAVCAQCGAPADYTQRTGPIHGNRMIGGRECYEPRCAQCFQPPPVPRPC